MSEGLDLPRPAPDAPRAKPNSPKVQCPKCGGWQSKVRDGRPVNEGGYKRKRECEACGKVFFTVEQAA